MRESWLVDLNRWTLTVHRDPGADGYNEVMLPRGLISPLAFPEESFTLEDLIGPQR